MDYAAQNMLSQEVVVVVQVFAAGAAGVSSRGRRCGRSSSKGKMVNSE